MLFIDTFARCLLFMSVCASMFIICPILNGCAISPNPCKSRRLISVRIWAAISFAEISAFSVEPISMVLSLMFNVTDDLQFSSPAFMFIPEKE